MKHAAIFLAVWAIISVGWCRWFPWEFGWAYWRHLPIPIYDGELWIIMSGVIAGVLWFGYALLYDTDNK